MYLCVCGGGGAVVTDCSGYYEWSKNLKIILFIYYIDMYL